MINPMASPITRFTQPQLGGFVPQPTLGQFQQPLFPQADLAGLSAEAMQPVASIGGLMSGLSDAYGMPGQTSMGVNPEVAMIEQQLAQLQAQLGSGLDPASQSSAMEQIQMLMALLSQLMGGAGTSMDAMAPAGGGGGAVPSGGSGGPAPMSGGGGGGAPSTGGGGGAVPSGGGSSGGSVAPSSGGETGTSQAGEISAVPPKLAKDDKGLAKFIEEKLDGSPLAGKGLGAHFVKAGRQNDVDPLALVAISRHETNHGRLGVGIEKHMGVGAFDSSPGTPRQWDGAMNQIYSGAKTFSNLREKGGSNSKAPLAQQLSAVNKAGWATDQGWHSKVGSHYNEVAKGAESASSGGKKGKAA